MQDGFQEEETVTKTVLVIGGRGRIGRCVAQDIQQHTQAEVTVTGRNSQLSQGDFSFIQLDLNDRDRLPTLISNYDLVVHCAGPFHHRDGRVLKSCIEAG